MKIAGDLRTLLAVFALVGVRRGRIVGAALLSGAADIAGLGVAATLLVLIRGIIGGGLGGRAFLVDVTLLYALIVAKNALDVIADAMVAREASAATEHIRHDLLAQYFGVGRRFYDKHSTSTLRDTLVAASAVPAAMTNLFFALLTKSISCLTLLGYLFHMSWRLTLMALAIAPLANVIINVVVARIRNSAQQYAAAKLAFGKAAQEILSGMTQVHAATAEARETARFGEASLVERAVGIKRARLERLVGPAKELGATTTLLMVAWGVGLFDSGLSIAELFVFLHLVQRMMGPLSAISDARIKIAGSSDELARVQAMLAIDRAYFIEPGPRPAPVLARAIEVRDLTFGYDDAAPILRDVSLVIPAGKKTGLVGESGSGKSSLLNVLFRFYDVPPGTVFVDGVDLRELDTTSWRTRIAYMSQDVFLFHAPLRDNLCYGAGRTIDDATLRDMLERMRLGEFLARLPGGLDGIVGERGMRASGGERQRIAIAQTLLRDADLYVFDEVTSALDEPLSIAIGAEISRALAGKTIVMTSHRPIVLADAAQIIALHRGALDPAAPLARPLEAHA